MVTKLRSRQGKRVDADTDADADAADQSNTYMSPFQATQKLLTYCKNSYLKLILNIANLLLAVNEKN